MVYIESRKGDYYILKDSVSQNVYNLTYSEVLEFSKTVKIANISALTSSNPKALVYLASQGKWNEILKHLSLVHRLYVTVSGSGFICIERDKFCPDLYGVWSNGITSTYTCMPATDLLKFLRGNICELADVQYVNIPFYDAVSA